MKPAPFDYVRATSAAEACALLRQHGGDARVIAGGQSLVPMMAMRLTRPAVLIDINEIAALKFIEITGNHARVGAGTRQCVAARDDALASKVPLLRQALHWVGHAQTRNRGTVGGSLAHADPAAELPLAARVLEASMRVHSLDGERVINASEFFTGPLSTALQPDECLEAIEWPIWPEPRSGSAFTEVSRRHGDFALIAACAQVAVDDDCHCTRVAFGLGGGAEVPTAFPELAARLIGTRMDDATLQDVANEAARQLAPGGDLHASAAYRMHLAATLAARVLRDAYTRAISRA